MRAYTTLPSLSANTVLTASYMNELNDNLRIFSKHNHSASLGEGASIVGSASAASGLLYRYEAQAHIVASQVNWSTSQFSTNFFFNSTMQKSTGVSGSIKFPVGLYKGTYSLWVMFDDQVAPAAGGSAIVILEGAQVASIRTNDTDNLNTVCKIDGIVVANSASTVLEFDCDNVGNNAFRLTAWKIKRTGS